MQRKRFIRFREFFALCLVVFHGHPSAQAQYAINTGTLNSYVGVHPRLFLSSSSIDALKTNIRNNQSGIPRWGDMWVNFKNKADFDAVTPPLPYSTPGSTINAAPTDAVALAWSGSGATPGTVTMSTSTDGSWDFEVGNQTMVLNRSTDVCQLVIGLRPDDIDDCAGPLRRMAEQILYVGTVGQSESRRG